MHHVHAHVGCRLAKNCVRAHEHTRFTSSPMPMRGLWVLLAAAAATASELPRQHAAAPPPPPVPLPWIRASNVLGDTALYDEHGRSRVFHGGNRVMKGFPWYFMESLLPTDDEFVLMEALGFNVVRLGLMWSGFNPAPGVFNETYLAVMKEIIAKYNSHGVYVLLDMHQDGLSSRYDGVPLWVMNKTSPARHAFPWPLKGNCLRNWELNVLTEASGQAYQDLYDNHNGMLDDLASFWRRVAEAFAGNPGVIGYETINEPFAGDIYKDPELLLPGVAGKSNLQHMQDAIAGAIRASDQRHLVFFEPVTWGMIFNRTAFGSGYTHVPGGAEWQNASVLSFHYYCSSFDANWPTHPVWRRVICDDTVAPLVVEAVKKDVATFGGGAFMTEGMACTGSSVEKDYAECLSVLDMLDKGYISWTDYGLAQGEQWAPSDAQQNVWSRTYARAVAGTVDTMSFNGLSEGGDFELCFALNRAIAAPTEIFASRKFHYASGVNVTTTPNLRAQQPAPQASPDLWEVTPVGPAPPPGGQPESGCVWVSAAAAERSP